MIIIGVAAPGTTELLRFEVAHGEDPKLTIWQHGYQISRLLSARIHEGEIVITAQLSKNPVGGKPQQSRHRGQLPSVEISPDEVPITRQRIAAYGIVVSSRGLLGTQNSDNGPAPGAWQLPGGGIEVGESPAEALLREAVEETSQQLKLNRLLDLQSDQWIGRATDGTLEDFHALRIVYAATVTEPTDPVVIETDGTTGIARWVSPRRWRTLPWTSGARSLLDLHLDSVRQLLDH